MFGHCKSQQSLGSALRRGRGCKRRFMPKVGLITLALESHLGAISGCASSDSWLSRFQGSFQGYIRLLAKLYFQQHNFSQALSCLRNWIVHLVGLSKNVRINYPVIRYLISLILSTWLVTTREDKFDLDGDIELSLHILRSGVCYSRRLSNRLVYHHIL